MFRKKETTHKGDSDPVSVLRNMLHDGSVSSFARKKRAVEEIVDRDLWKEFERFDSFGHFAIAAPKEGGLAIWNEQSARDLREILVKLRLYGEWLAVMRLIARKPGRPKTPPSKDGFSPFYRAQTGSETVDRRLLMLDRDRPDLIEKLAAGELTLPEAARQADLKKPAGRRVGAVCDLARAGALSPVAQGKLLCTLFAALGLDAQCALIANKLRADRQQTGRDPRRRPGKEMATVARIANSASGVN